MLVFVTQVAFAGERVVVVRDPAAVTGLDVDAARVRVMVSKGIQTLTGQTTDATAWSVFAGSNDVVGIKVNVRAAPLHAPHEALLEAVAAGLQSAGVVATNIIVWDVDPAKLRAAGYRFDAPIQVRAVIEDTGWDEAMVFESKVVGKLIWGDLEFGRDASGISERSHLPRLLTRTVTKLINMPVLLDHETYGLSGCLHNISLGAVDNARRFELTGRGESEIAEMCVAAAIKDKLVLNILDALVGGYAGGPSFKPQYSWPAGELLFSRDPVAVDTLCLEKIEKKRKEAHVPAIDKRAAHIVAVGQLGVGVATREKIEVMEVTP